MKTQKTQKAKKTDHELLTVPDLSRVCVGQFLVICEMFVDQCLFSFPFSFDVVLSDVRFTPFGIFNFS